jgi:hypothetical protein
VIPLRCVQQARITRKNPEPEPGAPDQLGEHLVRCERHAVASRAQRLAQAHAGRNIAARSDGHDQHSHDLTLRAPAADPLPPNNVLCDRLAPVAGQSTGMLAGMHSCIAFEAAQAAELRQRISSEPWLVTALQAVASSDLPDAWVGAGVIRDLVWGQLHEGFRPEAVKDIDVAFFDPCDLSPGRDEEAQHHLANLAGLPWEATNQAAVHTWFDAYFGGLPVPPLASVHDAVATWPETATCVAARLLDQHIDICAPHGLDDLLKGVWRRNPTRVTREESRDRLARHQVSWRWPRVTVIPP